VGSGDAVFEKEERFGVVMMTTDGNTRIERCDTFEDGIVLVVFADK